MQRSQAGGKISKTIKIKAKPVTKGKAKGEAIVTKMPISITGGLNPYTGTIVEKGHDLEGKSIAGKILIFPHGKGSTTGPWQFYIPYKRGNAPKAIINIEAETIVAVSAIITNTPMVHKPEKNPFELIKTGDLVTVDAENGLVEVLKAQGKPYAKD
jgi:predicted aconitase with swiveling domain